MTGAGIKLGKLWFPAAALRPDLVAGLRRLELAWSRSSRPIPSAAMMNRCLATTGQRT